MLENYSLEELKKTLSKDDYAKVVEDRKRADKWLLELQAYNASTASRPAGVSVEDRLKHKAFSLGDVQTFDALVKLKKIR